MPIDSPFQTDDVTVYCTDGGSNKYYRVRIKERHSTKGVVFYPCCEYGPRGRPLQTDIHKPEWDRDTLEGAREEMIKILLEKIKKKKYTTHPSGNPERGPEDRANIERWFLERRAKTGVSAKPARGKKATITSPAAPPAPVQPHIPLTSPIRRGL